MPAPCPGDPDYTDDLPFTEENVQAEHARLYGTHAARMAARRQLLNADVEAQLHPDGWDRALSELDPPEK